MSDQGAEVLTCGVDVGTSSIKVCLFRVKPGHTGLSLDGSPPRDGGEVLLSKVVERIRRRNPHAVAEHCFDAALEEAKLSRGDIAYVASTGEGHVVEFRRGHFYGMTTHARGAVFLHPGATGALDIGALHARAIRMDGRSKVLGYAMTSQCASGSGQFIENIARYLGVTVSEVGALSLQATAPEKVSGICAVLAETDVINMVSRGISTANILKGIHQSMADRLAKLLRSAKIGGTVVLTGGLSADVGLCRALEQALASDKRAAGMHLVTHPDAIFAGAMGAALWGAARHRKLQQRGLSAVEMSEVTT